MTQDRSVTLAARAAALVIALAAPSAQAGTVRCWIDQGVLVVPAVVAGAAGDYILDTGTRETQLHETRAQSEGFASGPLVADVRLAGLVLPGRPVRIVDLDARTYAFPTPIAGVIGADLLAGKVLDVSFQPCRVGLWAAGQAPRLRGRALPLSLSEGRPLVAAGVADGARAELGLFVAATGLDGPVRLGAGQARAIGHRPRLRALSFAGELWEDLPADVIPQADLPPGALGEIGPAVLAGWRLRFDFADGRLILAPRR